MGKKEGQVVPCPSVCSPTSALRLLSSRALSSGWVEGSIANLFYKWDGSIFLIKVGKILNEATIFLG